MKDWLNILGTICSIVSAIVAIWHARPFLLKLENSPKLKWLQVSEKWLPLR